MNIAYYCQHVLGIGHFHRSLAICRSLAPSHRVTMIVGGPDIPLDEKDMNLFRLPGLQMDAEFKNLRPCDPAATLEDTKTRRSQMLFTWFRENKPDVFIVELYPFGRKAFRFELDPVLKGIRDNRLSPCRTFVSLRDILVERPDDQQKFENRVVTTLNSAFDALLIHADEQVVKLEETFSRTADIHIPAFYTGFVTRPANSRNRTSVRKQFGIDQGCKLICASIGGGSVGWDLLEAVVEAFRELRDRTCRLQLFSGPYFPESHYTKLRESLPEGARLSRFSDNFPDWLQAADLSISMAGYNTSMNLLDAGVPAIIYPFRQNREQEYRIKKLMKSGTFRLIGKEDLAPQQLTPLIRQQLAMPRYTTPVRLDGAEQTRLIIETYMKERQQSQ